MIIIPDKSYIIQIFKGKNWELTFEKSNGIEVLDSGTLISRNRNEGLVDLSLRLGKEQDNNHSQYHVKLNIAGKELDAKDYGEAYVEMLDKFTTGKWSIDDIKKILETNLGILGI